MVAMTYSNTTVRTMERRDKRIWSKYNPSPVKRIDLLFDTSFIDS